MKYTALLALLAASAASAELSREKVEVREKKIDFARLQRCHCGGRNKLRFYTSLAFSPPPDPAILVCGICRALYKLT
jgi:hypothetical protein